MGAQLNIFEVPACSRLSLRVSVWRMSRELRRRAAHKVGHFGHTRGLIIDDREFLHWLDANDWLEDHAVSGGPALAVRYGPDRSWLVASWVPIPKPDLSQV